jgi:hypothetical protein
MRTEFYGIGAYPAESCTLMFVWVFTVNSNGPFSFSYNQDGPCEIQLASTRDLEHWERPFRIPCVPLGNLGEWDCGFLCTQSQALRVGDEIWLYYSGGNYTHSTPALYQAIDPDTGEQTGRKTEYTSSIGLAIWPLDRFVSVDGPAEGGILTTIPIKFNGKRLVINAATKTGGSVVVEICDAAGRPIKDFIQSDPFSGDNLRHTVTFADKSDVSALASRAICLRFHLKNAQLYSFAFRQ